MDVSTQTPLTSPILGKRAAPEDISTQSTTKMQKLAEPTAATECLFLTKLAQELRDQIYDYVAMTEIKVGLHVKFKEDTDVDSHAYSQKGLGHTCRQIRHEFSLRLKSRIKILVTEFNATDASKPTPRKPIRDPGPALDRSARSHVLQVADRKLSKGVYIQEDVAYTMKIPFGGIYDSIHFPRPGPDASELRYLLPGFTESDLRRSILTVTFASGPPRTYNNTYPLDPSRDEGPLWKAKGHWYMLVEAAITLLYGIQRANSTENQYWREIFGEFEILFPRRIGTTGNMLKGRSDKDHWWKTLDSRFMYFEDK